MRYKYDFFDKKLILDILSKAGFGLANTIFGQK